MKPFLALLAAFAAFPTAAHAQGGEGIVTVGSGSSGADCTFCVTTSTQASEIFEQAIAGFGMRGGEVHVLPGIYRFERRVDIPWNNVKITGSESAILVPEGSTEGIFLAVGHSFTLQGVKFVDPTPDAGAILVEAYGDNLRIEDCTFDIRGSAPNYTVVRTFQPGPVPQENGFCSDIRRGTILSGNTFLFPTSGPGVKNEVVGFRGEGGRDLLITGNNFRSADYKHDCQNPNATGAAASASLKHAILLINESHGTLSNNAFMNLGQVAEGTIPSSIIHVENRYAEGHHLAITGNAFEECIAHYNFELVGARFYTITGNMMGRCVGGIKLTGTTMSGLGDSVVISANQFHNIGLQLTEGEVAVSDSVSVFVENTAHVSLTNNQFSLAGGLQVRFGKRADGAQITGNQFVPKTVATNCIPEAVVLEPLLQPHFSCSIPGFGYYVRDNTVFGTGASGFERVVSPPEMDNDCAKIGGNWNFRSCVPRE